MGRKTPMRIEVDECSGFCFGVVRAIEMAESALARGPLISLGPIVHNNTEVSRLENLGLETAPEDTDLETLAGRAVLIRAHGEPHKTYKKARECGVELIDATCPVVARLQKTVAAAGEKMERVGGQVVIFGREGHAEVRGLMGQVNGPVIIVESAADLKKIDFARPIYFLAQTTSSLSQFKKLGDAILCLAAADPKKITIKNTVCRQVADRETHLADFAQRHDVVVFVADDKSSNGRVLFEAVKAANDNSHKIENIGELCPEWFLGASSVGICGATSTPSWLMNEVAEMIKL